MRILLCGDFSLRGDAGEPDPQELATRPLVRADIDNLDRVIARLAPAVELPCDGGPVRISFGAMDDFHPDRLFESLDLFAEARALRRRLLDPAGFAQARAELLGPGAESDGGTLQRLLGRPETPDRGASPSPAVPGTAEAAVDALVRRLVAADSVPDIGSDQAQLVQAVDLAAAAQMRDLLHHPRFQAAEAAWRTVQLLVTRLELDEDLQLWLFDATRAELDAAAAAPDLPASGLWKGLVEPRGGAGEAAGWSLVVVLEAFGPSAADVGLLAYLATVSAAAGAPVLATASPALFGCDALPLTPEPRDWQPLESGDAQRWQALRRSPLAPWIGLAAPRILLRLPFGAGTDPLERFGFEEMAGGDPARTLLWGHPGAACALLAGQAFRGAEWAMELDRELDVEDLPAWIHTEDGERRLYPCAEAWLGERAAAALLERGLMPLLSRRDRPAARLLRWQSIAEPPAALAGPWATEGRR
jgi:type VI secretion system protein ImpC